MSQAWRVFAAIDVTEAVRERMAAASRVLHEAGWKAKWVAPDRAHLTMHFYGDIKVGDVDGLRDALRPHVVSVRPVSLRLSGVGAFPNQRRPRVLWLGVDDTRGTGERLKRAVETATAGHGLEPDNRGFKPHLTIGRIRKDFRGPDEQHQRAFQQAGEYEPVTWTADRLLLIRSKLTRSGPEYSVIDEFPLNGTA